MAQVDKFSKEPASEFIEELTLAPLNRENAVRMMFLLCKHLPHFLQTFETDQDLNEHKLFDLYKEYSPIDIHKMSALVKNKVTLDELFASE